MSNQNHKANIKEFMTRQQALDMIRSQPTCDIPEFGWAVYGLDRNASYNFAKAGNVPLIQMGKRKKVIVKEALAPLGISTTF